MATPEKKKAYDRAYNDAHTRQVKFGFSEQYDADILAKLDAVPNKQGYVKELIRADIARAKSGKKEAEKKMKTWYIVKAVNAQNLKNADPDGCTRHTIGTFEAGAEITWREIDEQIKPYYHDVDRLGREVNIMTGDHILRLPDLNPTWHYEITDVPYKNEAQYHVKRDFWSEWGENVDEDTVITTDELINLSREWEKPVDELLEQLEEI